MLLLEPNSLPQKSQGPAAEGVAHKSAAARSYLRAIAGVRGRLVPMPPLLKLPVQLPKGTCKVTWDKSLK